MNTDPKGHTVNTTADNTISAHRQRALDALASLTTDDLLAVADALDMTMKADARAIAAADARAEKAGRRRWYDGSYSGEHSSTTDKRDRAPHLARARQVISTAIAGTYMATRD